MKKYSKLTFKNQSLSTACELILNYSLSQVEQIYAPLTRLWVKAERPDLNSQLKKLEKKISNHNGLPRLEDAKFKKLVSAYVSCYKSAVELYREHLSNLKPKAKIGTRMP